MLRCGALTLTEVLLSSLQGEEAFLRSPYHDLRHPMILFYGHPAALHVIKLSVAGLLQDSINAYYVSIVETGVAWTRCLGTTAPRTVWDYEIISRLIQKRNARPVRLNQPAESVWALVMGFETERIRLKTSSLLINELPLRCVRFPENFPPYQPSLPHKKNKAPAEHTSRDPVAGVHFPRDEMVEECLRRRLA